jgi:hypothetical protein
MNRSWSVSRGNNTSGPAARLRRRPWLSAVAAIGMITAVGLAGPAMAAHPEASLAGSNFEIDVDANLKVDDPAPPSLDWANVNDIRQTDKVNGTGDNSYAGGVKEDTACPAATTDSIPPNKSDLLSFQVYREAGSGTHPGFLNLAWSRVTDPTGTTLMDFEFNKSSTPCASGPNVIRTAGDLLIEYAIDQGGAQANMTVRTWSGTAWGTANSLTAPSPTCGGAPCAAGTINSSPIPAADSDGLITTGTKSPRTFGEAQIDLRTIFQPDKCASFGSATLKSRSSDAFNSQLKDFVSPTSINLTNCGTVIIRKVTDPPSSPSDVTFGYTKVFATDPASANTFSLGHGQSKTFNNVLFGSGYTVDETTLQTGWDFVSVDCSASTGVTPSTSGSTVTFAIDNSSDVLDCTYTNRARGTLIIEKVTSDGNGAFDFTSGSLTPNTWTLTTTAAGAAGKDARTFSSLSPGTYDAAETVPAGWNLVSATCSDGSDVSAIGVSGGETVTCTFTNARERGAILIKKERKHAADGSGNHPHAGVTFTVTGGELPAGGTAVVTDAQGYACLDNVVVSSLVGNYSVLESVPAGYVVKSTNPQTGIAVAESSCAGKKAADPVVPDASFLNMPLTNLTVSVDSQVDGGTASTMECVNTAAPGTPIASGSTAANGDGSATATDLEPGTYTCTVVIDP